jgi:hypothetical protein
MARMMAVKWFSIIESNFIRQKLKEYIIEEASRLKMGNKLTDSARSLEHQKVFMLSCFH